MTNIDQFESVFKAADKPVLKMSPIELQRLLVVSDLPAQEVETFAANIVGEIGACSGGESPIATILNAVDCDSSKELVTRVESAQPHMICTHRGLNAKREDSPFGLGASLEVLTQATAIPVLLLPTPDVDGSVPSLATHTVMAITDHLASEHRLVTFAASMTQPTGKLILTHVEDEFTLERFLSTIAKIPNIDTDTARETILRQLLQDPHDYIASCREVLAQHGLKMEIDEIITIGHRLKDHQNIVQQQKVDLVVMNTKDDDQLAMHGLAHPLTVELTSTPLLLL